MSFPHAKPGAPPNDEELDELPPMDGDSEEEEPAPEELDDELTSEGGDPFDDSTGEGDPLDEIETEGTESGWLDDAGDAEGLDVGAPDLVGEDESVDLLQGTDESGVEEEDFSLGGDESSVTADAGEEGFAGEDEEIAEDELPRLDSGDDGEADDDDLGEGWILGGDDGEDTRPPWDDRAWERAGAPLHFASGIDAVVCAGRAVIAAGASLVRVDLEGAVETLEALGLRGGSVTSIGVDAGIVAVATARGGVLVSRDQGATFAEVNGWRACVDRRDADGAIELALAGGEIWGRTARGLLVRSADAGETWVLVAAPHRVAAIGLDAGRSVVALARDGAVAMVGRASGGAVAWSSLPVLPVASVPATARLAILVRGEHVAVHVIGRGVFRRAGDGWTRAFGTAGVSSCTFSSDEGTLLAALYSQSEDRAWIAQARGADDAGRVVAEIGDARAGARDDAAHDEAQHDEMGHDELGRVRCLTWDEAHGVVWAAGGFGLVALQPPP